MKTMKTVKIKRLSGSAKQPTYGSYFAACADIFADPREVDGTISTITVPAHGVAKIPIGWAMQPPIDHFIRIQSRSGLASKGIFVEAGIVDEDFRGEIQVVLYNSTDEPFTVASGDKIAQIEIRPYKQARFDIVKELSDTIRGANGFGSTGTN